MSTEIISVVIETQPTVTNVTVTPPVEYQVNFYDIAVVDPSVAIAKTAAQTAATQAAASAASALATINNAFSTRTTTDLAEGANLYYTDARFDTRLAAKSTTNLSEGTNLYYTQARFDAAFTAKSTTNLSEGTNLYWTPTRFDTRLALKTTADLAENASFKYYTDTRAQTAAVVNSTAGSETAQAPSVSAMKAYVAANGTSHITAWATYTPTYTGFGTVSTTLRWRQVGENVEIRGKFTFGTPTAVEARVSLPNSYTSSSAIPSIETTGIVGLNASTTTYEVLIEPSVTYVTFGANVGSGSGTFTKVTGTTIGVNGSQMSIWASIPIQGLTP